MNIQIVKKEKGKVFFATNGYDKSLVEMIKIIPTHKWHYKEKLWSVDEKYESFLTEKDIGKLINKIYKVEPDDIDVSKYIFKAPQPYDHQRKMFELGIKYKRFGMFAEMGLGKTRVIVDILQFLKELNGQVKGIILCPKSLIAVWAEEIEKWSKDLTWTALYGDTKKKKKQLENGKDNDVYITNYETLLTDIDFGNITLVALDESQKIKNAKSRRTKVLLGHTKLIDKKRIHFPPKFTNTPYRFVLTGTPITQNPLDFYTQINFLREGYLGKSFYAFRGRYAVMGGYMNYQITEYKNLEELEARVSKTAIILKKDDCLDLPDKIYEKRVLLLTDKLKEQYKEMYKEAVLSYGDETVSAPIILTKMLRLQEITSGLYLNDKDKNPKLDELENILEDYDGGVVIWARFIKSLRLIKERLERKYKVATFSGSVSKEKRSQIIEAFQKGQIKVFIGQVQAGGVGITLHKSSLTIYYENTFNLEERLQSEDRIHRIGQTKHATYIDLVYVNTIDEKVLEAIRQKKSFAKEITEEIKKIRQGG